MQPSYNLLACRSSRGKFDKAFNFQMDCWIKIAFVSLQDFSVETLQFESDREFLDFAEHSWRFPEERETQKWFQSYEKLSFRNFLWQFKIKVVERVLQLRQEKCRSTERVRWLFSYSLSSFNLNKCVTKFKDVFTQCNANMQERKLFTTVSRK